MLYMYLYACIFSSRILLSTTLFIPEFMYVYNNYAKNVWNYFLYHKFGEEIESINAGPLGAFAQNCGPLQQNMGF